MTFEKALTAEILGELVPQAEYAAPVLLERFERGEPLVQPTSPTDLGFEGGAVDSVALEFFKAFVPYVKAALGAGMLTILQTWHVSRRSADGQAEMIAALTRVVEENAKLREAVEAIARVMSAMDKAPLSTEQVLESFASANERVNQTDTDRRRE
jgi:hypothetical protein